jgi:hypothetical protein
VLLLTPCVFDFCFYLTPLGQARQFIETCGTWNLLYGRKFVYFWACLFFSAQVAKKTKTFCVPNVNENQICRQYFKETKFDLKVAK